MLSPRAETGDKFGQIVPLIGLVVGISATQYVERIARVPKGPVRRASRPLSF
jgi:hypothetical protein